MLSSRLAATVAAALLLGVTPLTGIPVGTPLAVTVAQAQEASVSFSVFFDKLSTNGRWVRHARYKYVFCPEVDRTWAPYTHGHWVYLTDRGWYFDSDEPFAWAVYHYGRWFRDTDLGWCWVPGDTWAPAWVTWRTSNDYVGWAPLPPENDGFAIGVSVSSNDLPKDQWFFVPSRSFLRPQLMTEIVFGADKPDVFERTKFAGPVVVQNNVVVNNVININFIEQQTNQKVEQVKPQVVNDPGQVHAAAQGQTVSIFSAQVQQPKQGDAPKQAVDAAEAAKEIKSQPADASANTNTQTTTTTNGTSPAGTAANATTNGSPANGTTTNGTSTNGAATGTGTPPSTAGTGNSATPTTGKTDNGTATNGKPGVKCAADQMVNGACPPTPSVKGSTTGTANTTSNGSSTEAGAATTNNGATTSAAPGTSGSGKRTTTETTNGTNNNASGASANGNSSSGKGSAKCAADAMVNGVCPPTGKGETGLKKGQQTAPSQPTGTAAPAGAQTDNQSAGTANGGQPAGAENQKPARGKGKAACAPGEALVNGVCVPGNAKGANSGASQQQ